MSDFAILGTRIYEKSYVGNDYDEAQLDALFLSEGKIIMNVIKALNGFSGAERSAKCALIWSGICMDFNGCIRMFFDRNASVLSMVITAELLAFDSERMKSFQSLCASACAISLLTDDGLTVIVKYK